MAWGPAAATLRLTHLLLRLRGRRVRARPLDGHADAALPAPKKVMAHRAVRPQQLNTSSSVGPASAPAPELRTTAPLRNVSHFALIMSSLGRDFFAGGALGVASSAIAVVASRVEGSRSTRQRGGFVRAKRHLSAVAAKRLRAAFQTSSDRP